MLTDENLLDVFHETKDEVLLSSVRPVCKEIWDSSFDKLKPRKRAMIVATRKRRNMLNNWVSSSANKSRFFTLECIEKHPIVGPITNNWLNLRLTNCCAFTHLTNTINKIDQCIDGLYECDQFCIHGNYFEFCDKKWKGKTCKSSDTSKIYIRDGVHDMVKKCTGKHADDIRMAIIGKGGSDHFKEAKRRLCGVVKSDWRISKPLNFSPLHYERTTAKERLK